MRHYNRVLATQLAELQQEAGQWELAFSVEFGIEPGRRLNPRKLDPLLQEELRGIRLALSQVAQDLKQLDQPAGVKRFIKQEREQHRFDDEDPFGMPF